MKKRFHFRLNEESVELARELAVRLSFDYRHRTATGLFLEFAINVLKLIVEGKYQLFDTETNSFVDITAIAEENRNSNSDN